MRRNALDNLTAWKNSQDRKPLVIYGARQVGKTWLVREFAKNAAEAK
ncbi:MAG: AAA family ATPase [Chitinispirillales bacterium]|jgi:predicted AAA+ superfamily ATPase|nr:AAA family ATPase [Chitinispirillales bacterium]